MHLTMRNQTGKKREEGTSVQADKKESKMDTKKHMKITSSDKQAEEFSLPKCITQQTHQQASEVEGQGLQSTLMEENKDALVNLKNITIKAAMFYVIFTKD